MAEPYEWIPIEMLIKNESYDDSHLGVSNHYGTYVKMEEVKQNEVNSCNKIDA